MSRSPQRRSPQSRSSRSRLLFFVLSLLVVSSLVGGHWVADAVGAEGEEDSLFKYLATFTEVLGLVRQAYVDEAELDSLMIGALDGTTEALDPFSLYIPADEVEPFLAARRTGNRLSGLTLLKERGIAFVVAVDAGSPADQAGIRPGDVVSQVDGASTRLLPLWEIQEALAGEPGSRVEMELLRAGEELSVSFELTPYEAALATLEAVERNGVSAGVLHVARFEPATVGRVEALLGEAREAGYDRLLVDLRSTAGGEPEAAYGVAGLFTGGELGKLIKREETLETYRGGETPPWSGRLVVLVNRGTLSAAEVLATVLRQRLDAELVGEETFGYAGRQDLAELSNGGRLLYTDAFYTGPDGEPLNAALEPDTQVDFFTRTYEERDLPAHELIYRRGLDVLFGTAEPVERAA
jgi:carboxyl-terminal processing protease